MEFNPGDLVELKSGGPVMTVEEAGNEAMTGGSYVSCIWFEGTGSKQSIQRATMPPAVLVKVK